MSIHLWRTHRLRNELARDQLTEQDSVKYMFLSAFLYVQAMYSSLWFGGYRDWTLLFEALMVFLISIIGTRESFKANGGVQGRDFILRFCALAVPIGLKVALLALAVSWLVYFGFPYVVTPSSFRDPGFVYRLLGFVLALSFTFIYYWRIAHHIGKLNATPTRTEKEV